jgi:hypothetical protein
MQEKGRAINCDPTRDRVGWLIRSVVLASYMYLQRIATMTVIESLDPAATPYTYRIIPKSLRIDSAILYIVHRRGIVTTKQGKVENPT